ncbi:hypothetical protein MAMMFC1_01143 [Methylomusa anaerophila]|uniref:Hemolysin-III related n=1 Tax=Methylomusa anaerophila TaxID=1930071 RepID=A0A348AHE4_9FIRM|nr:hypothetical protein MAMMFC1_01143 [Methylomusa anaerophila]
MEERLNEVTHGLGALLSLVGLIILVVVSPAWQHMASHKF